MYIVSWSTVKEDNIIPKVSYTAKGKGTVSTFRSYTNSSEYSINCFPIQRKMQTHLKLKLNSPNMIQYRPFNSNLNGMNRLFPDRQPRP